MRANPCPVLLRTAALVAVLTLPGRAAAQTPRVGDVQRLPVVTIALRVGSTEKESRQITYTPPPGWYVRSHAVQCTARSGHSSFSVATVPANWSWRSEEKVEQSSKVLLDLAGRAHDVGLQTRFCQEQDNLLRELRRARSTHHALVVEATARGEGFLRGGGGIELTVTAELVYVGTEDAGERVAARQHVRLGEPRAAGPRR